MKRFLPTILWLAILALAIPGCAGKRKPKSSARIYTGDAPSIKMSEAQTAGGELRPY